MKITKFILIFFISLAVVLNYSCKDEKKKSDLEIELVNSSNHYEDMYYVDVYNEFMNMGFKYIKYNIVYDLEDNSDIYGNVLDVTVKKDSDFNKGDIYSKLSEVVISYHSFKSKDPNNSPIKDTYDRDYRGETYRVNFILNYDSTLSTSSYNVYFRIDGAYFKEVYKGAFLEIELDLKPGLHTISFTRGEDIGTYDLMTLNIDEDMMVTYSIVTSTLDINASEVTVDKDFYCVISFNSNGGSEVADRKVKKGQTIYELESPLGMDDYRFKGWWFDEENKLTYPYVVNSDLSLMAIWRPKSDYVFELCFKRSGQNGIEYLLIDLDKKRALEVETDSEYVTEGYLVEDNSNGLLAINFGSFPNYGDNLSLNLYIEYISETDVVAYYGKGFLFSDVYYKVVDSEDAEKYLDSIGYKYK